MMARVRWLEVVFYLFALLCALAILYIGNHLDWYMSLNMWDLLKWGG